MTSLERMMAAINGEPLDRYPVMNPYPFWSMQPHWPELTGLTFAHVYDGSDEQRMSFYRAAKEQLGVDCLPVWRGPCGRGKVRRVENEAGECPTTWQSTEFPLYIHNLETGDRMRVDHYYEDPHIGEAKYKTIADVEAEPPPQTAEELLSPGQCAEFVWPYLKRVIDACHDATPFSPPSGPARRLVQGPTPKANS